MACISIMIRSIASRCYEILSQFIFVYKILKQRCKIKIYPSYFYPKENSSSISLLYRNYPQIELVSPANYPSLSQTLTLTFTRLPSSKKLLKVVRNSSISPPKKKNKKFQTNSLHEQIITSLLETMLIKRKEGRKDIYISIAKYNIYNVKFRAVNRKFYSAAWSKEDEGYIVRASSRGQDRIGAQIYGRLPSDTRKSLKL